jgi:hypothetical protein
LGQITFSIDAKLEEDFRRKAGTLYGARRDSIGVAIRDAIRNFLTVNNDISTENSKPEVQT